MPKTPIKFGKVSADEINMTVYEPDTSANAVILCDYGVSYFNYTQENGFQVNFNRTIRIKILKKEGYDWAKKEILFRSKYDKIGKLKDITFTKENGKIVKTKLERSQIYDEEYNKSWDITKFENGNRLIFNPNIFNQHTSIPKKIKNRQYHIDIDFEFVDRDTITTELPKGYSVEFIPDSTVLQTAFGAYSTTFCIKDNNLTYIRHFEMNAGYYEPDMYADFRNFLKKVTRLDNQKIVFLKNGQN